MYEKSKPTEELVKMAEVVLRNNYFQFNSNLKHQISGTAIGTKFAPPYACIYMDYIKNQFLKNGQSQPWIWFRHIDDIFLFRQLVNVMNFWSDLTIFILI